MTSDLILYTTEDGLTEIQLKAIDGTVWLSQAEIAELFSTTKQNVSHHIASILEDKELTAEATVKEYLTVQKEGERQVQRNIITYNLDMILAVGYRVKSPRGIQFRKWATTTLREYLIKGFVMNDERLKNPQGWDYFDEWLERVREIRASEKRFYQKIRDIFALSTDYKNDEKASQDFFAEVQNKMLHAVTGHTAPELIVKRADPKKPNMNLQSWSGSRVRKHDVIVAKNYLVQPEIKELDRIVTMFLDYAEDRLSQRQQLTMDNWREYVDRFIQFNERQLLQDKGRMNRPQANRIAEQYYEEFDTARRHYEAIAADKADEALATNEDSLGVKKPKKKKDVSE
jgi:hypothetical protein